MTEQMQCCTKLLLSLQAKHHINGPLLLQAYCPTLMEELHLFCHLSTFACTRLKAVEEKIRLVSIRAHELVKVNSRERTNSCKPFFLDCTMPFTRSFCHQGIIGNAALAFPLATGLLPHVLTYLLNLQHKPVSCL